MKRLAVLGRGVSFPLSPGSTGTLDYAEGPEKVRQSIRIILETEPAERIMRPSFGVGLRRFLMKPNTAATRARIKQEVERGLAEAEPRIQLDEVRVAPLVTTPPSCSFRSSIACCGMVARGTWCTRSTWSDSRRCLCPTQSLTIAPTCSSVTS